jgi:DNA repair protein RadD
MLREYQTTAVSRMLWAMTIEGNSLICLPVGSGKTHVIAEFTKRIDKPVLIFTNNRELLEQDLEKLQAVVPADEIGVFSASLHSKEVKRYTLATIQSAYKHPELFNHYTVVIIDEASGLNPKNLTGMYNSFFKAIGNPKVIGLDACLYRLDSFYRATGKRWQPWETITTTKILTRYKERFWKQIIYCLNTKELTDQGFLVPLTYEDKSFYYHEQIPTNKSSSDFDLLAFEELIGDKEPYVAQHIVDASKKHKSILTFCVSISQAERLSRAVQGSRTISSKTPSKEREEIINGFKDKSIKIVFNVNCLTRGFNHPCLDAIYMLRPTKSVNLYVQMLGRGTRIAEGKTTCTVYDFAGNLRSIGPLEGVKMEKVNNLWNVTTNKHLDGLHMLPLYAYSPVKKSQKEEWLNH